MLFKNLLIVTKKLNPSDRPTKIRKMMEKNPEILQDVSLPTMFPNNNPTENIITDSTIQIDTCTCAHCPARQELDQLSKFYMEFLQEDCKV